MDGRRKRRSPSSTGAPRKRRRGPAPPGTPPSPPAPTDATDASAAPAVAVDTEAVLPDASLLLVLALLGPRDLCRAALVNRRWHSAARSPALWSRVRAHFATSSAVYSAAAHAPYLRALTDVDVARPVGSAALGVLCAHCRGVRRAALACGVGEAGVAGALWPELRSLVSPAVAPGPELARVLRGCAELRTLDVPFSDVGAVAAALAERRGCCLERLSLVQCGAAGARATRDLAAAVERNSATLRALALADDDAGLDAPPWGDAGAAGDEGARYAVVDAVARTCARLTELSVVDVPRARLEAIAERCTELRKLLVPGLRLTSPDAMALAPLGRSLTSIDLSYARYLDDQGLADLLKRLPLLRELRLSRVPCVAEKTLEAIAGLAMLEDLDVAQCRHTAQKDLARVVRSCPLRSVNMSRCLAAGNEVLAAMGKERRAELRRVSFAGTAVSVRGIRSLLPALLRVTELRMTGCKMNDRVLPKLVECAPQLRVLHLGVGVTRDAVISALGDPAALPGLVDLRTTYGLGVAESLARSRGMPRSQITEEEDTLFGTDNLAYDSGWVAGSFANDYDDAEDSLSEWSSDEDDDGGDIDYGEEEDDGDDGDYADDDYLDQLDPDWDQHPGCSVQ
eukprot:m51a1_g4420 hypothetical protein (626) ;mRNA; f:15290-17244